MLSVGRRRLAVSVALVAVLALASIPRLARLAGPDYDWDEGVYWQSLEALRQGHHLFAEVYSSQPPLFLGALQLPYAVLGGGIVAARLPLVVLSLVGMVALFTVGRAWSGSVAGVLGALLLGFDPLYLRLSDVVEADLASAVWGLVAVAVAAEARRRHGGDAWWLLVGVALGVGTGTKLLAVAFATPVALLAVSGPAAATIRRLACVGAAAGLALTAALLPYASSLDPVYRQVIGLHLGARVAEPQSLTEKLAVFGHGGLGPATLLAAALGVGLAALARRGWVAIGCAWLLTAVAVDAIQGPMFNHHLTILVPPLAVMGGAALPELGTALRRRAPAVGPLLLPAAGLVGVLAAVAMVSVAMAGANPALADPGTRPLAEATSRLVPAGAVVVTDNQFAAATDGNWVPPALVDDSFARITAGDLTTAQVEREADRAGAVAVILGTGRLAALPGLRDWLETHFRLGADLGSGHEVWLRR